MFSLADVLGVESDELERQFDEAERRENVASEFERLKQQLAEAK